MNVSKRIIENFYYCTFILFFITFSIKGFGQQLVPCKISEDVSIQIPQEFVTTDTLGQNIIRVPLEEEVLLIMNSDKKSDSYIEDKDELLKFYEDFQTGMLDETKGKLINKSFIQINGLYFLKSSFRTRISGTDKLWNNYLLLLNKNSYTFILMASPESAKNMQFFEEKIIPSIKFRKGLTQKNQFNTDKEDSPAYNIGKLVGTLSFYGLIGGIILFFILRKRRNK